MSRSFTTIVLAAMSILALAPASPKADDNILATVGDRAVTAREIEQSLVIPLFDLEMEKYRMVRRRLDQKIADELLASAAAAAGKSVSAYVTEQIQPILATVSDEDVEARYQQVRERAQNEPTPDQLDTSDVDTPELAKQQIRNGLLRERASQGLHRLLQRLSAEAHVSMDFRPPDPPVLQLSEGNDPSLGPVSAAVTIVEYADFECPACRESVAVLKQLRALYPDQVRLVHRYFPLPAHPGAKPAAEAAYCAYEQGQFWAYHDALFSRAPMPVDYSQLARDLHLDTEAFHSCLSSGRPQSAVSKDIQEARRLGISGTPTFFVNGRYLSGFQTLEALRTAVDRELINAAIPVRSPLLADVPQQ
jgi:protein-disulfide isomerase